jgi:trans-aconitate methyltransferase
MSVNDDGKRLQEFDYQWRNLPSQEIECTEMRVRELLQLTGLPRSFFRNKKCLDAGCGKGRWTWAMMQMGAEVDSIDVSSEGVAATNKINPNCHVQDIMSLEPSEKYDFVLSWGVLHHLEKPFEGFKKVASQVAAGGMLHVMVYNETNQRYYEGLRKTWKSISETQRLELCKQLALDHGGSIHGWWDALNPTYNWGFSFQTIKEWFTSTGFRNIRSIPSPPFTFNSLHSIKVALLYRLRKNYDINMNGRRS